MITINDLSLRLCKDIVHGVFQHEGTSFIATNFSYPIGDSVNLYLVEESGVQKLSDCGTTNYMLRTRGINLDTQDRQRIIEAICELHGLESGSDFSFTKPLSENSLGQDALSFCEAITRISTLHYEQRPRHYSGLDDEVSALLQTRLPKDRVKKKWFARSVDPEGLFPVDYHINTTVSPRDIFVVSNQMHAEQVVGTVGFLHGENIRHPTMSIVAPDIGLPRKVSRKLEHVSKVTYWGGSSERYVIEFAQQPSR